MAAAAAAAFKTKIQQPSFKISDLLGNTPAKIQQEIRAAKEFELGLITGFAAGKTRGVCAAAIEHGVRYPGAKVLLGRRTYQETVNTVKLPFFEMARPLADAGWFVKPLKFDYREGTNHAQLSNGSMFIFSNLDDPVKFRNEEYSMIVVDQAEEIGEELWEILLARVRWDKVPADARRVIAAANDNGHNWVWRRFVEQPRKHALDPHRCPLDPCCMFLSQHPDEDGVPRQWLPCATRRFFHGTTLDNRHNLAPKYLSILLSHPMEWQRRFIYADMESSEGRLLPDPVIIPFFEPLPHWPKWRAMDHALNSPACCVWLTVNVDDAEVNGVRPDAVYCYREYYQDNRSVDQHSEAILRLSGRERFMGDVMDRSAFHLTQSRSGGIRVSIADIYREESGGKLIWSPSVGDPFARVERIVSAHRRGLVIASSCPMVAKQMPEYYAQSSRITGVFSIVNKSDFHAIDALGYGLMIVPINASSELQGGVPDDRPEYLRRANPDLASVRHNTLEWKRFKRYEEAAQQESIPALAPLKAEAFWGADIGESQETPDYDPFYGGR